VTLQWGQHSRDGEFVVTPTGLPELLPGVPGSPPNDGLFGSFCVELHEGVSLGPSYNAVINTMAIQGGGDAVHGGVANLGGPGIWGDPLSPKTAWLYHQYRTGAIVLQNGIAGQDFQVAIWLLEDELTTQADLDYLGYAVSVQATAWSNLALASNWQDIGPVRVLNLGPASTFPYQDILAEVVPEPVTMAGLMMGIGGLVTYVRKRRMAA